MKIDDWTSEDVRTVGGVKLLLALDLPPTHSPKLKAPFLQRVYKQGRSTRNALLAKGTIKSNATVMSKLQREEDIPYRSALRCTYGREQAAYDYLVSKGISAFYPATNVVKLVNGKRKVVTESRLPNIFFAYDTEEQLKSYVYDNVYLPFRFYYRHIYPLWSQNREDTIESPRLSYGKSENYLCSRC